MQTTEEVREYFSNDIYATETTGIKIDEASESYARCSVEIERKHLNAGGTVMGGVIFTLADFAFAVAANINSPHTVSLGSSISFLSVCKGKKLIAEAKAIKAGRSTCTFCVDVKDELETHVATLTVTGFRMTK